MQSSVRSLAGRALAWLLIAMLPGSGCVLAPLPAPVPGLPEFQALGVVPVPGGLYSVAGRNLMVHRSDVSVDTRILAGMAVDATWNSATKRWHWSYETRFDGATFVDREGAVFEVGALPDGAAVPGTYWVRVDADTVKTKGGLVFDFDAQGRLDAVSWSSDPYPRYRYVRDPASLAIRECVVASQPLEQCRLVFTVDLGPSGPTRIVDEESARVGVVREARYDYDLLGRLVGARTPSELDAGLPGTAYEYGSGGLLSAVTSSEGERIEYRWVFDWLAQVTQVGEGNPSHAFSYPQVVDGQAGLYSVVHANPLGGRTKYTFTEAGHVTVIERLDAAETMTVVWHEESNRPTRIVGFDGAVREFPAWLDDDPTTVIEPSGNVVQIAYLPDGVDFDDPFHRPIASIDDSLGPVTSLTYDAAGRPKTRTNGEGETASVEYLGAEISMATAPWGGTVDFVSYGVHGKWQKAEFSWAPEVTVQRRFDRVGNLLVPAAGLQEGGVLERAYDLDRRLEALEVGAVDESGSVTATAFVSLTRRSDGQPLSVERPYGADHAMEYDALGRVERQRELVDGVWQDTTYAYDAAGNLTAVEQPNGMREELDHDLYGRTLERRILRDGVVEAYAQFEWTDGRLARWYDSVRTQWETFGYDAAGRARSVTWSGLGESLTYEYDLRSRTTKKTFAFGAATREIGIEWDLADRRTRIFTWDAAGAEQDLVRPEYAQGRLAAIEYGNGLRRENLFDPETNRFSGYRTTDVVSGAQVEETTFTREAASSPTRLQVTSRTETPLAITQEQYWLGLGGNLQNPDSKVGARVFRWLASTWIDGVPQDVDDRVFAWDERSNMVDDSEGDVLSYNAERNRLLAATVNGVSHTYTYDEAGYATSRDGLPITWTAAGRLATLGPAADPLVEIEWDLAGRPVRTTALGATRELALFGGRVEYDAGTGQAGWLHLTHVSLPFEGGERRYRHLDGLGNVSFTTDEAGTVTSHRRYHPFGLDQVYGADGFGSEPRGFVGGTELRHEGVATGLVALGARVLDSDVGRFLSPDPVLDLVNAYTYAYGNPVDYEDADGRHPSAKAGPSKAQSASGVFGAIAIYFETTAAIVAATGGPFAGAAAAVLVVIGGFFGIGAIAIGLGFFGGLTPPNICPCSTSAAVFPTSQPENQVKVLELELDVAAPASAPCAGAPVAASGGTAGRRWHWVAIQLLVLLYLIWIGTLRRASAFDRI